MTHYEAPRATLHRGFAWSSARTRGKVQKPAAQRATLHRDSRGRAHEREVKCNKTSCHVQPFTGIRVVVCAHFVTFHRDSCGRMHEREVKLQFFMRIQAEFATLHRDSCGRMHEREVKLQFLMRIEAGICNLSQGFVWSDARTRGKRIQRFNGLGLLGFKP